MKKIINLLLMLSAFVVAVSCEEEVDGGSNDTMTIAFEENSYSVAAEGKLVIPFRVANTSGRELTATVVCSNPDYTFRAVMSDADRGSIVFNAPNIIPEDEQVQLTLTVLDGGRNRSTEATVPVALSASDPFAVLFELDDYYFDVMAGESVTMSYRFTGADNLTLSNPVATASGGWTVRLGPDQTLILTAPTPLVSGQIEVTISVSDEYGRTTSKKITATVKEIIGVSERANCHMVVPNTSIRFDASHKGNSDAPADAIEGGASAELLWQDAPSLVRMVAYDAATRQVTVATTDASGNAVVAVKADDGTILWSWHIWVTDFDPEQNTLVVKNDPAYLMGWTYMERNLGATTNDYKSIDIQGLFYQWGRKDPFVGMSDFESGGDKPIYDIDNNRLAIKKERVSELNNLPNAIKNPGTFYLYSDKNVGDWYTTVLTNHNNDLWGGTEGTHHKTIYDPCPYGWRVPENDYKTPKQQFVPLVKGYCGYFIQDGNGIFYDHPEEEYNVAVYVQNGNRWYFPYSGIRSSDNGRIAFYGADSYGYYGYSWTANPYKNPEHKAAYHFTYSSFANGKANTYIERARGLNVRCVKDEAVNP